MKLLSVKLARSLWYLDTAELNPRGKNLFNDLVPRLIAEYRFKEYPKEGGDFKEGLQFKNGMFKNSTGDEVVVSGTIWADGIGADTYSSTRDSDEFIEKSLGLIHALGYPYDPSMVRRRGYLERAGRFGSWRAYCVESETLTNEPVGDTEGARGACDGVPRHRAGTRACLGIWP